MGVDSWTRILLDQPLHPCLKHSDQFPALRLAAVRVGERLGVQFAGMAALRQASTLQGFMGHVSSFCIRSRNCGLSPSIWVLVPSWGCISRGGFCRGLKRYLPVSWSTIPGSRIESVGKDLLTLPVPQCLA